MTADTQGFTPHGKHLIAGEWVAGETTFENQPATGRRDSFSVGIPAHVDTAPAPENRPTDFGEPLIPRRW